MSERDHWMRAVRERVDRVAATGDLALVVEDMALTEARELTRTLGNDAVSVRAKHLLGWLHWYRYASLPAGQDQQDLWDSVTMFTDPFVLGLDTFPDRALPLLADRAAPVAQRLLDEVRRSGEYELLPAATRLWQRIVIATPSGHPGRARRLSNLGIALAIRAKQTGTVNHLDNAIDAMRQAAQATPAGDPERSRRLSNMGLALLDRYELARSGADLDFAVDAMQQAVHATPGDHADPGRYLSGLSTALFARFKFTGSPDDIDGAVDAMRHAVHATPGEHPGRGPYLSNLGTALLNRFNFTGSRADLDEAISAARQAVQAIPPDHPGRPASLTNLARALTAGPEVVGTEDDLDDAIELMREAVQATPGDRPDRAQSLSDLGTVLRHRFQRAGSIADLNNAVQVMREAVETTPGDHVDRAPRLSDLGVVLLDRSERTGSETDLADAIRVGWQAVQAPFANHPDRGLYLSNLGGALRARFRRTGSEPDLDDAIRVQQEAVQATGDQPNRARRLSNLGIALRVRFERTGSELDLDDAIRVGQQAVRATPEEHPYHSVYLANLAIALLTRFERVGTEPDLDDAIRFGREAVRATPASHHGRGGFLSNLGTALRYKFDLTQSEPDLDDALDTMRKALQAFPTGHPGRPMCLSSLGSVLVTRFEHTGSEPDLDDAIRLFQEAVQATPDDQPDRAMCLSNLGTALRNRFDRTGTAEDRDAAAQAYTEAARLTVAPASSRIGAGRAAASLVAPTDAGRAASLLEAAVLLLPQVAPRSLDRGDQQYAIGRFAGLADEAAAMALSDPALPEPQRSAQALRLLEAARGVLLSQALSTRGDLSALREQHPELATRFTRLRDRLDRPRSASVEVEDAPGGVIGDRRELAAEFSRLLARIRNIDGFSSFGLPPTAGQLAAQAEQGPVVVFNVSASRSDAILLTKDTIISHRLPDLSQTALREQVIAFHLALATITEAASPLDRANAQKTIRQVLAWLWDSATGPILHILGYDDQPLPGQPWPQLWWVPAGLLSLLPIHAAGHHTSSPDLGHRAVMDRVISSYTPTVGALAYSRATGTGADPNPAAQSLIVAMPTTPDLPGGAQLPYVPSEAAVLQSHLPNPTLLIESPEADNTAHGELPTSSAVLKRLPGVTIAHFACHGYTDPADPSQSGLLLHDHRTNPFTVAAMAPLTLDHAQLAYLSACATASVADGRLLDEAIHLTSAFQLAGFPHVIGTIWEIDDATAVDITGAFYTALADPDGTLAPSHSARALHEATRAQRDQQPANPYLWASHIHAGA